MAQVGLRAVRRFRAQVGELKCSSAERPLIPLVVVVQVLLHEVGGGLGAEVALEGHGQGLDKQARSGMGVLR